MSQLVSVPTVGRTLVSIGSLQLRLRTTAPTVDAVHNAAMAAEEAGPTEPPLEPADSYALQSNPAVVQVGANSLRRHVLTIIACDTGGGNGG